MIPRQRRSLLARPALLLGAPALAQEMRTLSIGVAAPVTSLDPHFHDAAA